MPRADPSTILPLAIGCSNDSCLAHHCRIDATLNTLCKPHQPAVQCYTEQAAIMAKVNPQKLIMRLYASSCVAFRALYSCPPSAAARGGGTALPTCLCLLCTLPLKWKWSGKPCSEGERQAAGATLIDVAPARSTLLNVSNAET